MTQELNLSNVYRYRQKASKVHSDLALLIRYFKEEAANLPSGWYYDKHFVSNQVSREEAMLYTQAVLSSYAAQDSELAAAVKQAFIPDGQPTTVNHAFLLQFFETKTVTTSGGSKEQILRPVAISCMLLALDEPNRVVQMLQTKANTMHTKGWIPRDWFYAPKPKHLPAKKLTTLEEPTFRILLLMLSGHEAAASVRAPVKGNLDKFAHAWGKKYNIHKTNRDMKAFFNKNGKDFLIHLSSTSGMQPPLTKRHKDEYSQNDEDFVSQAVPTAATPAATRGQNLQPEDARTPRPTPNQRQANYQSPDFTQTPDAQPRPRPWSILSSSSKLFNSLRQRGKRRKQSLSPAEQQDIDNSTPAFRRLLPTDDTDPPRQSATDTTSNRNEDSDSTMPFPWDSPLPSPQPTGTADAFADDFGPPWRMRPSRDSQTQSTHYSETVQDEEVDMLLAFEDANVQAARMQKKAEAIERSTTSASQVMNNVCFLAAIGSQTVQRTMKAVLTNSMSNKAVTKALADSGYERRKHEKVVARKKVENEARRRRAARRGVEPKLVEELATRSFKAPLSNRAAQKTSQRLWNEFLAVGKDVPLQVRPSNIKEEKVDQLVKWIVDTCQFRPGKTRNIRFKRDKACLKNLPVYIRYGSFSSLYKLYTGAVSDGLRVGERAFRDIVKAITVKGTYNQGLSYYYVEFIDMTKTLLDMFARIKEIIADEGVSRASREDVDEWLTKAIDNTNRSREYLTHRFYADIQKQSEDGWTSASYALGETSQAARIHQFGQNSRLFLALSNHLMILHLLELVMDALPDEALELASDELLSMVDLALVSAKEMLHYSKHLMRGWWQDNAINEFKRVLLEQKSVKGCIMDHKNKLLPRSKHEAMSAYFSKAGVSILGSMIFWAGSKTGGDGQTVEGIFVWFVDMIMRNTTSQEARDLMPGIEAIRSELKQEYFASAGGRTDCICFISDNALVSASHSAFVTALNSHAIATGQADDVSDNDNSEVDEDSQGGGSTLDDSLVGGYAQPPIPVDPDNSLSDELDVESTGTEDQQAVDRFTERMRRTFADRVENWKSAEAFIAMWLTFEAQRGKTQLDTHFAYLNKQLAAACLEGNIDYLDPSKVFEALSYKGGSRATTTLLLDELDHAQTLFDECNKAMDGKDERKEKFRKGINSVHDITFQSSKVVHRNFTNLDTAEKVISLPRDTVPDYSPCNPVGIVTKRHINPGEPVFFAFKESLRSNSPHEQENASLQPKLLSTRLYNSLMRHSSGMEFAARGAAEEEHAKRREVDVEGAAQAAADIQFILKEREELIGSTDDCNHPIELEHYWAKKKNRTHMPLSKEVLAELKRMYETGQGVKNKKLRYTAERAVMELQGGLLKDRWDQRLIVSVSRVKSYFSRKHQAEEQDNDELRSANSELAAEKKLERSKRLLSDCRECEELILAKIAPRDLVDAALEDFASLPVELLKAFIKGRLLDDAGSREMSKMPKKGSLADNKDNTKFCSKTGKPFLIRWAFQLRLEPVKAKVFQNASEIDSSNEVEHLLFEQGTNNTEPTQMVSFVEDVAGEMLADKVSAVEEVDVRSDSEDEASIGTRDDSEASSVGCEDENSDGDDGDA